MSYEALRFWFDVVQFLLMGAIGFYVWQVNRHRVTRTRLEELEHRMEQRLDKTDLRLTSLERDVEHMPKHEHIDRLSVRIEALHGDLREVVGGITGLRRAVDLINEHLLNRDRS